MGFLYHTNIVSYLTTISFKDIFQRVRSVELLFTVGFAISNLFSPPESRTCDYLNGFRARELPVRSELLFQNQIRVIRLARAIMVGDNEGQREWIERFDFPDVNLGWKTRPVLHTKPPVGPYTKVLVIKNPNKILNNGQEMVWIEDWNPHFTPSHQYYPVAEVGITDYSDFYQDGSRIDLDSLLEQDGNTTTECQADRITQYDMINR